MMYESTLDMVLTRLFIVGAIVSISLFIISIIMKIKEEKIEPPEEADPFYSLDINEKLIVLYNLIKKILDDK